MGLFRWFFRRVLPALFNPLVALIVLAIALVTLAALLLTQDAIRLNAVQSVPSEVAFHAYMLGLFIPEGLLVGLIWNPGLRRYVSPFTGKMISGGAGIGLSVVYAFLGYFLVRPWLESGLMAYFSGWASGPFVNVLGYWVYAGISAPLLPFLMGALMSPAGAGRGLRWLWRLIW